MSGSQLKILQVRKSKAEDELKEIKQDLKSIQQKFSAKELEISKISKAIEVLTTRKKLIISEHAYLRYFERVLNYSLSEIESKILSESLLKYVETFGEGTFPLEGTERKVVIQDNVVVTIK